MKRRCLMLISALGIVMPAYAKSASHQERSIEAGRMVFSWSHSDDRLVVELTAPAPGWLAVGFNAETTLIGTRFVMAAVVPEGEIRAEEHLAVPGGHADITELGGVFGVADLGGKIVEGMSEVSFSLPHRADDANAVTLVAGTPVYLMLAWAHEPEFGHHSAWRRHFEVTL
ncbi:MAG: DOMON domain-containing protein [Pseudomonadota bacterium]